MESCAKVENVGDVIALASSYMSYMSAFIVVATLIVGVATVYLANEYKKDKKRLIEETTHNLLDKIADDEQMRNNFINKILENKNFKQEFERIVDMHISDKMDKMADKNQEKSDIGGFDEVGRDKK